MECILEANPLPEITWYQGNKVIEEGTRIRMSRKATGKDTYILTLEISNPTREDGGNYRCNAFNNFGESNANIALNFAGTRYQNIFHSSHDTQSMHALFINHIIRGTNSSPETRKLREWYMF